MKFSLKNINLTGWTRIGLSVIGVALLVWLVLFQTGLFDPPQTVGEKKTDPNRCPHCNMPLSSHAKQKGECLFCKGVLPGGDKWSSGKAGGQGFAIVLLTLFCVLVIVNGVFLVRALARKKKLDEDVYHMHCHKCDRKVRY